MIETEVEIIGRIADCLTQVEIPSFDTNLCAGPGFESPGVDYGRHPIDLNKELIRDKDSTFVAKVRGDSMIEAHVVPGSHLLVDKSIVPILDKKEERPYMVVAILEQKFTVKYYYARDGNMWLIPANKNYERILINESHNFSIWGVVTKIIIDTRMNPLFMASLTEITSIAPVKGYSSHDWLRNP